MGKKTLQWCKKHAMWFDDIKYRNGAKLAPCCPMCLHKVTGCNESLLAAQRQTLAQQKQELTTQEQELTDLQVAYKQLQADYLQETQQLRQELDRVLQAAEGGFWNWRGDGTDQLESLTCPVLVDPLTLQQWLQRLDGAYGLDELAAKEASDES